jgi:hypothetical protein
MIDPKMMMMDPKMIMIDPKIKTIDPNIIMIDPKMKMIDCPFKYFQLCGSLCSSQQDTYIHPTITNKQNNIRGTNSKNKNRSLLYTYLSSPVQSIIAIFISLVRLTSIQLNSKVNITYKLYSLI